MASPASPRSAELAAALAGDLSRALTLAVAWWRELRAPELADLVDRLAVRCRPAAPPPGEHFHERWIEQARLPYDPANAAALIASVGVRLRATDVSWSRTVERWAASPVIVAVAGNPGTASGNWLERLAAIASWPDDPQVAPLLAAWLTSHIRYVPFAKYTAVYDVVADRLIALGDHRVMPRLEAMLAESAGNAWDRVRRQLIARVAGALARPVPAAPPEVAAWTARLAVPSAVDRLWNEVAAAPAAIAPRGVLGDALLAAGESRGSLIALQLSLAADPPADARDRRVRKAARLIASDWELWLGDLAALVVRDSDAFRAGMLEVIRVGHPFTPRWLWGAVRGHRELACVHTVRPVVVPEDEYPVFLAGLPALRTLQLDSLATARGLARIGTRLKLTRLELRKLSRQVGGLAHETLAMIAPVVPEVTTIALDAVTAADRLREVALELPGWFPRLTAIEIDAAHAAHLAGVPLVRVTGTPNGTPGTS